MGIRDRSGEPRRKVGDSQPRVGPAGIDLGGEQPSVCAGLGFCLQARSGSAGVPSPQARDADHRDLSHGRVRKHNGFDFDR